jgi:RNA polymerase sigma-70 factor (ECF subfamily)
VVRSVDELQEGSADADERMLVERMRRGEESALDLFARRYVGPLHRFVLARLGSRDRTDAEDIVQTVMLNALRAIDSWRGDAGLTTWLCAIALREIGRNHREGARRDARTTLMEEDALEQLVAHAEAGMRADEPEGSAQVEEVRALVHLTLAGLPARQARALELKYALGCSSQEIAAELGMSDVAVQSLLARARRAFRARLDGAARTLLGEEG